MNKRKMGEPVPPSSHWMEYDDLRVEYELVRCNRRSLEIQIKPGGRIVVRAPIRIRIQEIEALFEKKETWIKDKYREQCNVNVQLVREKTNQTKELEKRYRKAAVDYIPKRVAHFAQILGVTYEKITIRDTKTRWGSCSSSGNLSFSWRLMLAPFSVLDYVVVHELCHRIHMNHSREFWKTVEYYFPEYREKKNWLKEHGKFLVITDLNAAKAADGSKCEIEHSHSLI